MDIRNTTKKIIADINITPFTDVVLVLLIVFMVATPIIYQNSVKITLPSAKTKEVDEKPVKIIIKVSAAGEYYLNNGKFFATNETDMAMLRAQIAARSGGESSLVVHADKSCRYELVVTLVDIAKTANVKRVVLATETKK